MLFFKKKKPDFEFYVVDDVKEQTKVIESILKRKFTAKITIFQNPLKLIKAIDKANVAPDLIISDQKMPEMTGLQLKDQLDSSGLSIPFIFITSADGEEIVEDDIIMLSKPINVRKLELHIRSLLKIA